MSSQTRAALEVAQAEVKTLDGELAAWPEVSPARRDLEARLAVLEAQQLDARRRALELEEALRKVRIDLDGMRPEGIRNHWWQSQLAVPAIVLGLVAAFWLTSWALDHYSWPSLGDHYGLQVLLAPVAVNGARIAWALFWRRRRRLAAK